MNGYEASALADRRETGGGDLDMEAEMEDIAIGEIDVDTAARTIAARLASVDDAAAFELYESLRSWTWKTIDARRRDEELSDWLDVLGRVASHLEPGWGPLALKLEACAELIQASIMIAGTTAGHGLATRKHVRDILSAVHRSGGRIRRREIIDRLKIKEANLTRIAAPLQDEGWIQRELVGREVFYRLTEKGRREWRMIEENVPLPMPADKGRIAIERKDHSGRWSHVMEPAVDDEAEKFDPSLHQYLTTAIRDFDAEDAPPGFAPVAFSRRGLSVVGGRR